VEHVAKIARLNLTKREITKLQKELTDITNAFRILDEAPSAEPSFQPIHLENVMREDKIEECLPQEISLKNTKHKEKGFFKGPKAV
jgi:aspartyl-tRNA(Asn)/glutamyl-tRNA(Gln) amidotransferase subunit C